MPSIQGIQVYIPQFIDRLTFILLKLFKSTSDKNGIMSLTLWVLSYFAMKGIQLLYYTLATCYSGLC